MPVQAVPTDAVSQLGATKLELYIHELTLQAASAAHCGQDHMEIANKTSQLLDHILIAQDRASYLRRRRSSGEGISDLV